MTHRSPLSVLLAKLQRRRPLALRDQQAVLALSCRTSAIGVNQHLLHQGDPVSHCKVVLSGFALRYKDLGTGRRQVVGLHLAGDLIGLQESFLGEADESIVAVTAMEFASFAVSEVIALCRSFPVIADALWTEMFAEAALSREWIVNVASRCARSRIAHLICEIALRQRQVSGVPTGSFQIPMTQSQLAEALGLTSVHINRTLRALETDGLLHRSRHQVTIPSWTGLAEVADFNPDYMHLPRENFEAA